MSQRATHFLLKLLHVACWCFAVLALLVALILIRLAYGFDGRRIQAQLDAVVPNTVGRLTVQRIAYRLDCGLILHGICLEDRTAKTLVSCSKAVADFELASTRPWQDRLTALTLDDLFVAQIEHDPNKPEDTWDVPHEPFPDLSGVRLPQFDNVTLSLNRPNVFEVKLKSLQGRLSTRGGSFFFRDLKADIDGDKQHADATIEVDLYGGVVKAQIRGHLFQTHLNGIYRALDFPIIEKYSNQFTLQEPAWADATFTVGFDKFCNIFHLRVDISTKKGSYCGVAFDEAQGTIRCDGIWDSVTVIDPLIARRDGKVIASGKLRFDNPADQFEFDAEGKGLMPAEALQLINMPFTQSIPSITAEEPPALAFRGKIPLHTKQTPEKVVLDGFVKTSAPISFDKITLKSANAVLSMRNGVFTVDSLKGTFPTRGSIEGRLAVDIPESADYTDLSVHFTLKDAALTDLLRPFEIELLPDCVATGGIDLTCRTDETFASSVDANFDFTIHGGVIGRVPLFAGFTTLMADYIPGVSTITDTSTIHLAGTAKQGNFSIPHFNLSGAVFVIEGPVSYNLPKDELYAKVIAGVFKRKTLLGTLTRWVTIPVTKLLWEIEVFGPINSPKWNNRTIVEKIWDYVPFTGESSNKPASIDN